MKSGFQWRWFFHILAWLLLWVAYTLMLGDPDDDYVLGMQRGLLLASGQALLFYINSWFLIPRFFFQKKYVYYGLFALLFLGTTTYAAQEISSYAQLSPWSHKKKQENKYSEEKEVRTVNPDPSSKEGEDKKRSWARKNYQWWRWLSRAFPYLIALAFGTVFKLTQLANQREQKASDLQKEKLETELKFLKSQINPHFLFNSLNNIYTLSVLGSGKTPENLLKLSDMLRYMLYEADAPTVSLNKEVDYLKNYIDLQLLKNSQGLNVEADLEPEESSLPIAPLLLIPFVENAFKHSNIEDLKKGWIKLQLTSREGTMRFRIENSVPEKRAAKDISGGIGLQNVKRRLDLLYEGRYSLDLLSEKERFRVDLKLDLK